MNTSLCKLVTTECICVSINFCNNAFFPAFSSLLPSLFSDNLRSRLSSFVPNGEVGRPIKLDKYCCSYELPGDEPSESKSI